MNNYYAGNDYDFNSIRAILFSYDYLSKAKINKLITLLNKKELRRHDVENKRKDRQKSLRKYHGVNRVTCKTR